MTPRRFVSVAVSLLGLYFLFRGFVAFISVAGHTVIDHIFVERSLPGPELTLKLAGLMTLSLLPATLVLIFRERIGTWTLFRTDGESEVPLTWPVDLFSLGFALCGVYFCVFGLSNIPLAATFKGQEIVSSGALMLWFSAIPIAGGAYLAIFAPPLARWLCRPH